MNIKAMLITGAAAIVLVAGVSAGSAVSTTANPSASNGQSGPIGKIASTFNRAEGQQSSGHSKPSVHGVQTEDDGPGDTGQ